MARHSRKLPLAEGELEKIKCTLLKGARKWFKKPLDDVAMRRLLLANQAEKGLFSLLTPRLEDLADKGPDALLTPRLYTQGALKPLVMLAKARAPDGAKLADAVHAHAVLCGRAARHIWRGEKLPQPLAGYIADMLAEQFFERDSTAGRTTKTHRNLFIVSSLRSLCVSGINPTRKETTKDRVSGCEIVAESLSKVGIKISGRGVEKIWREYGNADLRMAQRLFFRPPKTPRD